MASTSADPVLIDALRRTDLLHFRDKLCVDLQLTRAEHFAHIDDHELNSLSGLSLPAIRRLRAALKQSKRGQNSSGGTFKSLFGVRKNTGQGSYSVQKDCDLGPAESDVQVPWAATCLIGKDEIKLEEKLGEGSCAVVRRALWTAGARHKLPVAVKLLRDASAQYADELRREIDNMHRLRHPHLIRLYGIVLDRPIMMVVELCEGGALLDRLRSNDKPVLLATKLIDYALMIAKGMAYLESKRFIHRDLAARNVLLTADEQSVKIGDFGLMRALPDRDEHYVMSGQTKVPFAWCPPESLRRRQFSHASDVWSFGVVLWEIFGYGEEPWCGFRGPEILEKISSGERLQKVDTIPRCVYALALDCWAHEPEKRPRFFALKDFITEMSQRSFGIAEVREPQPVDAEGAMLELLAGDRVIIVEGTAETFIWYGQCVRSRRYGKFARRSVRLTSTHMRTAYDISRPLTGSFMHTGHGDARGGPSWGQPDEIDPIYLKNPMPLVQLDALTQTADNCCHAGAQKVDSLLNLKSAQPKPLRPPPPSSRQSTRINGLQQNSSDASLTQSVASAQPSVSAPDFDSNSMAYGDPFAPFDDAASVATRYASQPPMANGVCDYGTVDQRGSENLAQSQPNVGNNLDQQYGQCYYSVPPSSVPSTSSAAPAAPATSTPRTNLPASYGSTTSGGNTMHNLQADYAPAQPYTPQSVLNQSSVPHFNWQQCPSGSEAGVSGLSAVCGKSVSAMSSAFSPVRSAADLSPDPFDVSGIVAELNRKMRYSDMLTTPPPPVTSNGTTTTTTTHQHNLAPTSLTASSSSPASNPVWSAPSCQTPPSQIMQSPHALTPGFMYNQRTGESGYGSIDRYGSLCVALRRPTVMSDTTNPHSVFSDSDASYLSSGTPGFTRSAAVRNTLVPHSSGGPSAPGGGFVQLQSRPASVAGCVAPVSADVLDMFDPLCAHKEAQHRQGVTGAASQPGQCAARGTGSSVDESLKRLAPFAPPDRRATVLRRFNNDINRAALELKLQKLTDMGLAPNRQTAERALAKTNGDLNAAAEQLCNSL